VACAFKYPYPMLLPFIFLLLPHPPTDDIWSDPCRTEKAFVFSVPCKINSNFLLWCVMK
jgi:hypothetical protein